MMQWWKIDFDGDNYRALWSIGDAREMGRIVSDKLLPITSLKDDWSIPDVKFFIDPAGDDREVANFSRLSGILAGDEKVISTIGHLISNQVELLPVNLIESDIKYSLIHVINDPSCLDHEQSEFNYWDGGGIKGIKKAVFLPNCLDDIHIMRIPEAMLSRVFVSNALKEIIENSGLTGVMYKETRFIS